jgi:uncharacterized protein YjiS (DUF1127 family)
MTNIQCRTLRQHHIETPREFDGFAAWLPRGPRMLFETLVIWQRRAQERHRLATLGPHLLRDMGISEAEAAREAAIPFWRLK